MTKVLKVALMGSPQFSLDEAPLEGLVSGKAQALLCYLAVTGRAHSRQALAGLLWSEMPEADARRNLRGVVMKLRQWVEPYLVTTAQTVAFNRESAYWLDVEIFQATLEQRMRKRATPEQMSEAVALYRGDFLEDFYVRQAPAFEAWVTRQRAELRQLALNAYQTLAAYYAERGELTLGIEYARHLINLDPVHEEGQRQLMTLLARRGQRSAALTQFEVCRAVLAAELGVSPSPETIALYERIRTGEISQAVTEPIQDGVINVSPAMTPPVSPAGAAAVEAFPPFIAGPPVTQPRHFFGRERELKRLFNLLKHPPLQNAAIIGPRRSGKTSLLHYLKNIATATPDQLRPGQRIHWLSQPERYCWILVDFQDPRLGGRDSLLRYLLSHMSLPAPEVCDLDSFLDVVSENLRTPTVILMDEIGVALQRYPELDDAFWESLRSLATNQVEGNLAFVLAGPEAPEELARYSGLGSPFFNIFGYTATLGPLTEAEARELILTSPIPFAEEDVAWILAESGRWPILLQILCRERLLALEDGETDDSWRSEAWQQLGPFRKAEGGREKAEGGRQKEEGRREKGEG